MFTASNTLLREVGDIPSPQKSVGALSQTFLREFNPLYLLELHVLKAEVVFSFLPPFPSFS